MLELPLIFCGNEQEENKEEKKGGRKERKYELEKKMTYFASLDILVSFFLSEIIIQAFSKHLSSTYYIAGIVCDPWDLSSVPVNNVCPCGLCIPVEEDGQ